MGKSSEISVISMRSVLIVKSWRDLSMRKTRTLLTITTIAISIGVLGGYSTIPLIDRAVIGEANDNNVHNIMLTFYHGSPNDTDLHALEEMGNIKSIEPKYIVLTRMEIGTGRRDALIVGVRDFSHQQVDIVQSRTGHYPMTMEIMAETNNRYVDPFNPNEENEIRIGDSVSVFSTGDLHRPIQLTVSGTGASTNFKQQAIAGSVLVFYTTMETIQSIEEMDSISYNILSLDLKKDESSAATLIEIQAFFPESYDYGVNVREDGSWPSEEIKQEFYNFAKFYYLLALLILFCSLFIISNTMHTIIGEQRRQIAQMKAVGASSGQVFRSYVTTGLIIGITGSIIGVVIGIFISYWLMIYLSDSFLGVEPVLSIYTPVVIMSFIVGIGVTVSASMPALVSALKITVREGMGTRSRLYEGSFFDRPFGYLSGIYAMGLRNFSRRRGRSWTTVFQVVLAVGMLLALMSVGYSLRQNVIEEYGRYDHQIFCYNYDDRNLTVSHGKIIESIDGVRRANPVIDAEFQIDIIVDVRVFGYTYDTIAYDVEDVITEGRWITHEDQEDNSSVIVISKTLSKRDDVGIGDEVFLSNEGNYYTFRVVGIHSNVYHDDEELVYVPITTLQAKLGWEDKVTGFAIEIDDNVEIDRLIASIEDRMMQENHTVKCNSINTFMNWDLNEIVVLMIILVGMGTVVMLVTMIGLINTVINNVLDRGSEIGILKCIGSRKGHIKRIFVVEALLIANIGYVIGTLFGYILGLYLNYRVNEQYEQGIQFLYPVQYMVIAYLVTVGITMMVVQIPLLRAVRLRTCDALRYE